MSIISRLMLLAGLLLIFTQTPSAIGVTLTGSDLGEQFWIDNNDVVYGGGGNDTFLAQRSYISGAVIYAGPGNDTVSASNWRDITVYGEAGNDFLAGGYIGSYLDGGDGDDTFLIEKGTYTIFGGAGNDIFNVVLPQVVPILNIPEYDPAQLAKLENSTIHGDSGIDRLNISADVGAKVALSFDNGFIDVTITYLIDRTVTIRTYDVEIISLNGTLIYPNQSIGVVSFSTATLIVGGTATVSASSTSGLAISFSSITPTVCSITERVVTAITNGSCIIAANQPGDANFNAATQVTGSIAIANTAPNGKFNRVFSE